MFLSFAQIGIGELADRDEQCRDAQALQRASQRFVAVVGGEREAGEIPHRQRENEKAEADETL